MKNRQLEYASDIKVVQNDSFKYGQLSMFPEISAATQVSQFRPIHYLGSKLRILDFIQSTIDQVEPSGGGVCDLFAGSGTVSRHLSKFRPVTSVDIQEYSRVICSALLKPISGDFNVNEFLEGCQRSSHYAKLYSCIEPMIEYEACCIDQALHGDPNPLCELLEKGSILSYEQGINLDCSSKLIHALKCTVSRLEASMFTAGAEALVVRYFGGVYFSYLQSVQIDSILEGVQELPEEARDIFLASVLSTASDIVNTVGKQFAQPIKPRSADGTPKKNIGSRVQKDREKNVFHIYKEWVELYLAQEKSVFDHYIYKMDYSDALDILSNRNAHNVKVVYADPPYTRYHYSRYYHVLETICLRDNPKISRTNLNGGTNLSRGMYREDRHQSPFSIKSQATTAFENLFRKVRELDVPLVLSYSPYDETKKSTPRVHTINGLEDMARRYFSRVETISAGQFSHSKLNNSNNNFDISYEAELLIICQL
ncbi:DNA adenine methylase [Paenibacillus sp. P96]|uniref:site-specific DNA-methyltransferase (adenine-specific) n=1 Tax=Paenibacillus zeirhizosphaerae TaxID=2987519 RepID=A0ABT9FPG9_9BACL|nr:DNA adenine methylase [Paenibacillus sp. P96]MDP4096416.1 DNA adenine methylase [Paenibacillus sp. P96]